MKMHLAAVKCVSGSRRDSPLSREQITINSPESPRLYAGEYVKGQLSRG